MINFAKNMALLGGALVLMAVDEPWPVSLLLAQPSKLERVVRCVKQEVAA